MSASILHGRRKGQARDAGGDLPVMVNGHPQSAQAPGMVLPNGTDLRQVTVLSKGDWDRIQYQLNKRVIEAGKAQQAQAERERLHQLSKERVQNWTNTFAGQRQRKLEARKLREEKEEEERKQIDLEEAKFQAEKRKEAIERAKTQQYYQTDRVKGFHGALLLTEVLKERDAQLELKRLKESTSAGRDREWVIKAERENEEAILKDQREAADRINRVKQTASFQKAQINEHLKHKDQELEELEIEGEELQRLAAQNQMEKKRLDEIRNAEAKQLMSDNLKQIDDVHKMKKIHKFQEEEEDEECRIFAAAKRKMMMLRADKERQLHNEKQESLEQIRQKLHAQMQQAVDDEDDRIQRAMEEGEQRRTKEDAMKEERNRKAHSAIAEHRYTQMRDLELQAQEKRRKELEMLMVRKEADAIFAKNEEEKRRRKFGECKDLQNFHSQQIDERKDNAVEGRDEQLALDQRNQDVVELEERQFQEYARRVINHCDKGKRNTFPLHKAAREGAGGGLGPVFPGKGGVRPSYMTADQTGVQLPNYQRYTTDETKKVINSNGQTNKRLGFVW